MLKSILLSCILLFCVLLSNAQTNYLDSYIGKTVALTTIGTIANQINQPRDLDFKPNSNELWVCNYGSSNGGNVVIFYNAGLANQKSQNRKDSHSSHFMDYPSSIAFGEDGRWASVGEIQNTAGNTTSTFMGPSLWSADTSIFARVFQNDWLNGYALGSHLDMLHQSPLSMGIAHDTALVYWVMDGYNGNICKYDFSKDHGPGYEDHSAGKIWRYSDVTVSRVVGIPSHMILDKINKWLYFIDGGSKTLKRLNTKSGSISGTLSVPATANESLTGYWNVKGAIVETLDTFSTQPCGIDYYNGRLIVSDYKNGNIYLYNTTGGFSILDTISTGHPGMMGIKVGPDGHIWCVNKTENKVYRLDVTVPLLDASILNITSPIVNNYLPNYYSSNFNICDNNIAPSVEIANTGSTIITDMEIHYMIDGGPQFITNWVGSLAPGSNTNVDLTASILSDGNHQIDGMIMKVNGINDDVELNNRSTGSFRVLKTKLSLPFTEGFTSTIFPPNGWNYVHYNPTNYMSRATIGGFGLSTGCLRMDIFSGQENTTGQKDYMMLPLIDMTTAKTNVWLSFNVAYAKFDASSNENLKILASTDCGNTWTSIYSKSGTLLSTAANSASYFTPTKAQWRKDSVNLASYAGQSELLLMFSTTSNYGNNIYLDDIFIGNIITEVAELNNVTNLKVNPNPANDYLKIEFDASSGNSIISVIDLLGKPILSQPISFNLTDVQLNTSSWENGVYFIKIKNGNAIKTQKVLVQH